MRTSITFLLMTVSLIITASPVDSLISQGNQAYMDGDFAQAISFYSQADEVISAADLDLNLGNAYYKNGEVGKAIVHYERAHKLRPLDEDIMHNLTLARNITLDKLEESTASGFSLWWRGVLMRVGMDTLAILSILMAIVSVLGWLLFRVSGGRSRRQLGFTLGSVFLVLTLLTAWMSLSARGVVERQDEGIILSSRVEVLSAPDEGSTELFVLHEGSKVQLIDSQNGWTHIALPNGNKGWMKADEVEGI